jgi:hypothetical protein
MYVAIAGGADKKRRDAASSEKKSAAAKNAEAIQAHTDRKREAERLKQARINAGLGPRGANTFTDQNRLGEPTLVARDC